MRLSALASMLAGCGFTAGGQSGATDAPRNDGPRDGATVDGPPVDALASDAMTALDAPPDCATSFFYTQIGTSRYIQLPITATTWPAAEAACELAGSHLIVFDDAAEIAATDTFITGNAWVGVTDRNTEGTYLAVTAQTTFVAPANAQQPDDCVRLENANDQVDDRNCNELNLTFCECDLRPVVPANF